VETSADVRRNYLVRWLIGVAVRLVRCDAVWLLRWHTVALWVSESVWRAGENLE
jgi:hypothetical protein